jgi:hypothetical protein
MLFINLKNILFNYIFLYLIILCGLNDISFYVFKLKKINLIF